MIVVNFTHPLTASQQAQIETCTGQRIARLIDVACSLDQAFPFAEQVAAVVNRVGLSASAWQSEPIVINPPAYAPVAAILIAELHGRMGHFPTILRIRPLEHGLPTQYEVAEIVDLLRVREAARRRREDA